MNILDIDRDRIKAIIAREKLGATNAYRDYEKHCGTITNWAKHILKENNIQYRKIFCSMFPESGLCIIIELNNTLFSYTIPVGVFFEYVKTQEDIKLYAI